MSPRDETAEHALYLYTNYRNRIPVVFSSVVPVALSASNDSHPRLAERICAMELTTEALKKMCRNDGLYSSPALNDKLYLHYKVKLESVCEKIPSLEADGNFKVYPMISN